MAVGVTGSRAEEDGLDMGPGPLPRPELEAADGRTAHSPPGSRPEATTAPPAASQAAPALTSQHPRPPSRSRSGASSRRPPPSPHPRAKPPPRARRRPVATTPPSSSHAAAPTSSAAPPPTASIALLLDCFCSVAVATIGYVTAMLLVKIKEEELGSRVKFARRAGLPDPSMEIVFAKQ
nr:proline-rich receptor-like protein kinase PERK10 [Lolium perenne]